MFLQGVNVDLTNAGVGAEIFAQQISLSVLSFLYDMVVLSVLIEKQIVLLDHLDYEFVVASHIRDIFGPGLLWSEHVRPNSDCHVVRGHFVERLIFHNHFEDLDVEFEGVKVDLWQLLDPVLEL